MARSALSQLSRFTSIGLRTLLAGGLALAAGSVLSQTWTKQSPIPTARHLNAVAFTSPAVGFVAGEAGTLLKTDNGGVSWQPIDLGMGSDPFYDIYFRDSLNGFVIGNTDSESDNFRTTDGGATWTRFDLPAGSWREMKFVSATTGFVGANGAMCRTLDGGASWQTRSAVPNAPIVYGMDFSDANTGIVCGYLIETNQGGIFKTADGGVTWSHKFEGFINDAVWLDANVVLACGDTSIYRSTNAGETWNLFAAGIDTGLLELIKVSPTTVLGVSLKGDIWRSANAGLSWNMVYDGLGDLPVSWNIGFADPLNGWVVGQGGLMLRTNDGGLTWTQATNGFSTQWYQIKMANSLVGYIAGQNGYILRTKDGGVRWEVQKVEVTGQIFGRDESLSAVSVIDANTVVVAGPGGTVFKTLDGGDTWVNIGYPKLPDAYWIEDVKFLNALEGWVVGLDQDLGHFRSVYHTVDGGLTWVLALEQNSYFFSVDFVDTQRGWIASIGALYFRTVDGGVNWTPHVLPPRFVSPGVSEIRFANANVGWVVGWDGLVGKSVDGGLNFTYQDLGRNDVHMFGLSIVSTSEVWISGRTASFQPVMYRTLNGGTTWTQVQGPNSLDWVYGMWAMPGGVVFGVGYDGMVFRRDGTTTTNIAPATSAWLRGVVQSGNNTSLAANDDNYFVAKAGLVLSLIESPAQLQVEATAPTGTVEGFDFDVVSKVNTPGLGQRIELYNWSTGLFETVGTQGATMSESTQSVSGTGTLSRYVQAGTRTIRAKVSWYRTGLTLVYPWTVSVDQVRWRVQTQ